MANGLKVICSTSDKYLHLIPVFIYLFNKYFPGQEVEIAGYQKPSCELPDNFTFHSMGEQGTVKEWSTDLRKYFESMDEDWILWMMEDTFIRREVKESAMDECCALMMPGIGRIALTNDLRSREHTITNGFVYAHPNSRYRLSTQPSIWNKQFLLQYLTDGLSPWEFETQDPKNDGWNIVGAVEYPVIHNEGVRRFDPHKLDLNNIDHVDIDHINKLLAC